MSKFDLGDLLNGQSAAAARPAGMKVTMIARADLLDNPENKIYRIGDVTQLAEDIAANGIRQPLEVVPSGDKYLLIGGHRRLAACEQLAQLGDNRFDTVPCIIHPSKGAAMDKLDLITANATARELTDGERLDQYIAMKDALEQLKKEGNLEGRVRDEMSRRLGESTGSLGRLNAIAANATEEVKQAIRDGNCGFIRAYEASKLHPRQQMAYVKTGKVPLTPPLTDEQKKTIIKWVLNDSPAVEYLKKWDYSRGDKWNFMCDNQEHKLHGLVDILDGPYKLIAVVGESSNGSYINVSVPDPADEDYTLYASTISWRDLYDQAKRKYQPKEEAQQLRDERRTAELEKKPQMERIAAIRERLVDFENWPESEPLGYGLRLYKYPLADGGYLGALAGDEDDYLLPMFKRFDANGNAVVSGVAAHWLRNLDVMAIAELSPLLLEEY